MISTTDFRKTIGNFATGVTVVTTRDENDDPRGFTVNAFSSLSLVPPLVIVCVDRESDTYPMMERAGVTFTVNILAEHQKGLSRSFACKGGAEKFQGVRHYEGTGGAPILDEVLAFVECEAVNRFDGGDHMIVVGKVKNMMVNEDAQPLIFYRGEYGTFNAHE